MDSCQLFTFLFGSRRATSDLSKHFTNISRKHARPQDESGATCSAPSSPLKQIQTKLASLTSRGPPIIKTQLAPTSTNENNDKRQCDMVATCDVASGTYRATLVESLSADDIVGGVDENNNNNNSSCATAQIIENPCATSLTSNSSCAKLARQQRQVILYGASSSEDECDNDGDINSNNDDADVYVRKSDDANTMQVCDGANNDMVAHGPGLQRHSKHAHRLASAEVFCAEFGGADSRAKLRRMDAAATLGAQVCEQTLRVDVAQMKESFEKHAATSSSSGSSGRGAATTEAEDERPRGLRNAYVRNIVQSFESSTSITSDGDALLSSSSSPARSSLCASARRATLPVARETSTGPGPQRQCDVGVDARRASQRHAPSDTTTSTMMTHTSKPITFVKPMPPQKPPKPLRAKCVAMQAALNKPRTLEHLFCDDTFLARFFEHLEPLDRCTAAQVCRKWRNILYASHSYWKDLVNVIDCTQLRREYTVECIMSTLHSAKLKQQQQHQQQQHTAPNKLTEASLHQRDTNAARRSFGLCRSSSRHNSSSASSQHMASQMTSCSMSSDSAWFSMGTTCSNDSCDIIAGASDCAAAGSAAGAQLRRMRHSSTCDSSSTYATFDFDQDDVWRIQELCNRYAAARQTYAGRPNAPQHQQQMISSCHQISEESSDQSEELPLQPQQQQQQQQHRQPPLPPPPKSSSIPSQISSTISSVSLSSLWSPVSEAAALRVETLRDKLYASIEERGFKALCLFGATDDDVVEVSQKTSANAHERMRCARLDNCCVSNHGVDVFATTFAHVRELELNGCNEITNSLEALNELVHLKRLLITDCINISDAIAHKILPVMPQLDELTVQAYHLTDAFLEFLALKCDCSRLKRLALPNCKDITNESLVIIARHFSALEALSVSGSTKISDDGIEVLTDMPNKLKCLDLSWCSRITDATLECLACEFADTLTDLILDRNTHVTDIGLGYLATMDKLRLLHIRWCARVTDVGLERLCAGASGRSLELLSVAGLHQITARSLLALPDRKQMRELELTNCPAVSADLVAFLAAKMPKCNIIV